MHTTEAYTCRISLTTQTIPQNTSFDCRMGNGLGSETNARCVKNQEKLYLKYFIEINLSHTLEDTLLCDTTNTTKTQYRRNTAPYTRSK